jgi:hypothetical protein
MTEIAFTLANFANVNCITLQLELAETREFQVLHAKRATQRPACCFVDRKIYMQGQLMQHRRYNAGESSAPEISSF